MSSVPGTEGQQRSGVLEISIYFLLLRGSSINFPLQGAAGQGSHPSRAFSALLGAAEGCFVLQGDHSVGKYRCLLCQKEFSSESGVKYHIIKAHSEVRKQLGMVQAGPCSNTPVLRLPRSIHPCLLKAERSSSQQHQQCCDSLGGDLPVPLWVPDTPTTVSAAQCWPVCPWGGDAGGAWGGPGLGRPGMGCAC